MRCALLSFFLLLAGCTNASLQQLRQATPEGTPFQMALSKLYMDYASQEDKHYHWLGSAHFAEKGLQAAYGKDVPPEDLKDHPLPPAVMADMAAAHDKLMGVLAPDVMEIEPQQAANAQFYFDCWLDKQERDASESAIIHCRDGFFEAINNIHHSVQASDEPATTDKPTYIVFFEWDKSTLTKEGYAILDQVIESLSHDKAPYEIVLGGHTDTSGSTKYNLRLSQLRAETVKEKLVVGGLKEEAIKIYAYGESDPLVPTPKGVREPRNRRVEIFLQ